MKTIKAYKKLNRTFSRWLPIPNGAAVGAWAYVILLILELFLLKDRFLAWILLPPLFFCMNTFCDVTSDLAGSCSVVCLSISVLIMLMLFSLAGAITERIIKKSKKQKVKKRK